MSTALTHSPAHVVGQLLLDLGLGTDPDDGGAWPVHVATEPNSPNNVLTVYDTAGSSQGRSMIDGELFAFFGFQVRVRAKDHVTGWTKASAVRNALAEDVRLASVTVEGTEYLVWSVDGLGQVLALGKDRPPSDRFVFTLNGLLVVGQETGGVPATPLVWNGTLIVWGP